MKNVLCVFLFLFNLSLFSQNIELIGGLNSNSFYDFRAQEGHYKSTYNSNYGFAFRVSIEDVKVDWLNLRFSLSYDEYGGELAVTDGGNGGGYSTNVTINKSVLSLGVFPINFKIVERINLNFGFEIGALLNEKFIGNVSGWQGGQTLNTFEEDLNARYNNYSEKVYFGIRGRIAYDFKLSEYYEISPQYSYYLGLTNEFQEFPEATKSMRHYFCIGLQRKIK